jgi:hypothetical protein
MQRIMRIMVEATWESDNTGPQGEIINETDLFFLLHWGLDYTIVETDDNHRTGVSYTIGICENVKSGEIRCFRPEQIKIIGREGKE